MGFIGGLGIWGYVGALVVGAGVAGVAAWETRGAFDSETTASVQKQLDDCNLGKATDAAKANAKTSQALSDSLGQVRALENELADKANARDAQTAALMEKLSHVPHTTVCMSSSAIRAYLDSVRNASDANSNAH